MIRDKRFLAPLKGVRTLREFITTIPEELENHTAFINSIETQYEKITYGEARRMIEYLGTSILNLGIHKGDRVGLLSENRSEWAIVYFAVTSIGAVLVPLDIILNTGEILPLLQDAQVKMVFSLAAQKVKIDAAKPSVPSLLKVIVFDRVEETREVVEKKAAQDLVSQLLSLKIIPAFIKDYFHKNKKDFAFSDDQTILVQDQEYLDFRTLIEAGSGLCKKGCTDFGNSSVSPADLAVLIYTSGTTGQPKGVMLSHLNLASDADEIQMLDKMSHNDRWVTLLPLHHTFPTMAGLLVPFLTRGTIKFLATLRTDVIFETFKEMKVTSIAIVPLFLEKVYKNIFKTIRERGQIPYLIFRSFIYFSRFCKRIFHFNPGKILFGPVCEKLGLTHLKYFISGGGPIAREILKGFNVMGIFVAQGYGLSETSPTLTCNGPKVNRFGSVGFPLKNVEIKIDQPDRKGNGEILTRAPYVMMGYYNQPDKTSEVIDSQGWFHTGDIGRMDPSGFLWITGRLKNIIVTAGGKNVYPEEIEELLLQSDYISEAVVIGSRDFESNSELPYAIVYPNFESIEVLEKQRSKKFNEDELYDFIGSEIKRTTQDAASYKKLTGFELIYEELPKTSSKKVKRFLFKKN